MRQNLVHLNVSRSWLLVNAAQPSLFDDALNSSADQLILDVEDAVAPEGKPAARQRVVDWLSRADRSAWVRINDVTTSHWADDIAQLRDCGGVAGIVLAKTESPRHIADTVSRWGKPIPIIALVESAVGIENAVHIAEEPATMRLAFGSGDYRRDTGAAATDLAMAYPRSRLTVASRVGGLPGPIDGPTLATSAETLRDNTTCARDMGMTGRLCLHADQAGIVNSALEPSIADIKWARTFLDGFVAAGATLRDGSDKPQLFRANRIIELAAAYGTKSPTKT